MDINKYNEIEQLNREILSNNLITKRVIDKFVKKGNTILEIGPGSGYFAPMVKESGLNYIGLEVTQAFYIFQSKFWNFCFKNNYSNFVFENEIKKVNHIPWWQWCSDKLKPFNIDLIVANHVLCEMHPNALLYTFNKSIDLSSTSWKSATPYYDSGDEKMLENYLQHEKMMNQ